MTKKPKFHLPYPVFDTHFHAMHMAAKGLDPAALLEEAFSENLVGAVDIATGTEDFEERLHFASSFPQVRLSAGIHPSSVGENLADCLTDVESQARLPEVVAIGETGLDFFRDYSPVHLQEKSFAWHLDLAYRLSKPVVIHNRDADQRVLDIIRDSSCRFGIFHCFSSDTATAEAAIELGFYISFAGNVTFKNNPKLREVAAMVPENRLLLETDAPFLSPDPRRGRTNHPGHIGYTLALIAEVRSTSEQELSEITVQNSLGVFGLS